MGKTTLTTTYCGQQYGVRADWAQAACPVEFLTGTGEWETLQYQVADFRHDDRDALRHSIKESTRASGDDPDDYRDQIEQAVASATTDDD